MDNSVELQVPTYYLSVDKYGQKTCTLQSDPTKKYILDASMTEYPGSSKKAKPDVEEQPMADENSLCNDSETDSLTHPTDPSQLGVMHLDTAQDFEENLMNQLDANIMMNVDPSPSCRYFMQHMDIRDPLSQLKKLLEKKLKVNLQHFTFTLQDTQTLEDHKNLVDQCVQGEGIVQVNVYILFASKRINIIDVLKPADDYVHEEGEEETESVNPNSENEEVTEPIVGKKKVIQWQVDGQYKKIQEKLKIPLDPEQWNRSHVRHWLHWAERTFNLSDLKINDWNINGQRLCNLTLLDFKTLVPNDPGDIFWTHLELLRKIKLVAIQRADSDPPMEENADTEKPMEESADTKKPIAGINSTTQQTKAARKRHHHSSQSCTAGNRGGNNSQIQLWQFLLELLTNREHYSLIQWTGNGSEFKLCQPDMVAQLWGERKNKPSMNYEKLSRALRYYYEGDMISKVPGKRFAYKFGCDLKQVLGYSALELANLVRYGNPII